MLGFEFLLALALAKEAVIGSLVSELGADQFDRRERATLAFGRLGPLPYAQLRRATASRDPEVRRLAERLLRPLCSQALAWAAKRQVVLREKKNGCRRRATLVSADGNKAYLLADTTAPCLCREGLVAEWGGQAFPVSREIEDGNTGLALMSFPCRQVIPPIPLPSGPTKGLWWNHNIDLNATFKEHMTLTGVGNEDIGCGVFSLEEASMQVVLIGVFCPETLHKDWTSTPTVPGPDAIRRLLEAHRRKASAGR
jgi:hypothetical protein